MTTTATLRRLAFVLSAAILSACAKSEPLTTPSLPEDQPCQISVSDGGNFSGFAYLSISQKPDGSRYIQIVSNAAGLHTSGSFGGQVPLSDAQAMALAHGDNVTLADSDNGFVYSVNDVSLSRPATAMRLSIADAISTLTVQLGAETEHGTFDEVATATVRGQIVVGCTPRDELGNDIGDPMYTSEFCQSARNELGLDAWIAASR